MVDLIRKYANIVKNVCSNAIQISLILLFESLIAKSKSWKTVNVCNLLLNFFYRSSFFQNSSFVHSTFTLIC